MKKVYYLFSLIIPAALLLTAHRTGSPGGKTGSPGDNNSMCNDCHIGTPLHQEDWISADIPVGGYLTGETYTITLTATNETAALFGFEVTAEDDDGNKIGEFILLDDVETRFTNNMEAVTHTENGTQPVGNTKQWTVGWIAPTETEGTVTFYAAFNSANGDGNNTGDIIHFSEEAYLQNTTGIGELAQKAFSIYPNPAHDFIVIEQQENPAYLSCSIASLDGKIIRKKEIDPFNNKLALDGINPGVYMLILEGEAFYSSRKLVVSK